jgi:hypothetical protein
MPKKGKYVIVRTYSAGVSAGNLISKEDKEVTLSNACLKLLPEIGKTLPEIYLTFISFS